MKTLLAVIALVTCLPFLQSCAGPGGAGGFNTSDLFIAYTEGGVQIQNTAVVAPPGQETRTANGVGYNTKTKKGYITYVAGNRSDLKITGGGISANSVGLVLENGTTVKVNFKTGVVTTEGSGFDLPPPTTPAK